MSVSLAHIRVELCLGELECGGAVPVGELRESHSKKQLPKKIRGTTIERMKGDPLAASLLGVGADGEEAKQPQGIDQQPRYYHTQIGFVVGLSLSVGIIACLAVLGFVPLSLQVY